MKLLEILKRIVTISFLLVTSSATAKKTYHTHGLLRMNLVEEETPASTPIPSCKVTDDCASERGGSLEGYGCDTYCQRATNFMDKKYYFCSKDPKQDERCTLSKNEVKLPEDRNNMQSGETKRKFNPVQCKVQTSGIQGCQGYGATAETKSKMCMVKKFSGNKPKGTKEAAVLVSNDYMGKDPMVCATVNHKCQRSNEDCCVGTNPKCCNKEGYLLGAADCLNDLPTVEAQFQSNHEADMTDIKKKMGTGRTGQQYPLRQPKKRWE